MIIDSNKKLNQFLNNEFEKLRRNGNTATPNSKYFGQIGSTSFEDIKYNDQLKVRLDSLKNIFSDILDPALIENYEIVASPKIYEYRLKMEFVSSYNPIHEPHSRFGQRKKGNFSWVVDMDECNLIEKGWFTKIREVYTNINRLGIRNYDLKKQDGILRYIVSRIYKESSMINIVVNENIGEEKMQSISDKALQSGFKSIYWILQNSLSDISNGEVIRYFGDEFIQLPLTSKGKTFTFQIGPENFFQNNIYCFEEIIEYIHSQSGSNTYLYDLYCGVGTIGILLSDKFKKIIGIEIIEDSIKLAKLNALKNKVSNTEYIVADLNNNNILTKQLKQVTAIVDPPRLGLQEKGVKLLESLSPNEIIYISCNPITQASDLKLLRGYKATHAKGFDMFPHTNHIENVVILKKI